MQRIRAEHGIDERAPDDVPEAGLSDHPANLSQDTVRCNGKFTQPLYGKESGADAVFSS